MGEAVKKFRCPECRSAYTRHLKKENKRYCNHCGCIFKIEENIDE